MNNETVAILYNDFTDEEIREFLDMADFVAADPEKQDEAWKITNDRAADWAVKKVKEEEAEYFRLNSLAHEQIAEINAKIEAAEKRMNSRTAFLKSKLAEYFGTVPHRETKTQEQYQLLSGKLVFTKPKQAYEKDEANLLSYLKASGLTEYIQTTEKPMWGDLKKQLTIFDGKAVLADTGEVIPDYCVRVVESEAKFEVK